MTTPRITVPPLGILACALGKLKRNENDECKTLLFSHIQAAVEADEPPDETVLFAHNWLDMNQAETARQIIEERLYGKAVGK